MISLLNNNINKMHKTTITIIHFIAHQYIYIHIFTDLLVVWDWKAWYYASCSTQFTYSILQRGFYSNFPSEIPMVVCFLGTCPWTLFFKVPIKDVQYLYAKRSGNSLGSSFSDGCNKNQCHLSPFLFLHRLFFLFLSFF